MKTLIKQRFRNSKTGKEISILLYISQIWEEEKKELGDWRMIDKKVATISKSGRILRWEIRS